MSEKALAYAKEHAEQFRNELLELIRIPGVSTDPAHKADIQKAAEWVAGKMRAAGLETVEIFPTARHPVVYGEWLKAGDDAPTVLVYGHYDVQPAVIEDGWDSDPFEPVIKDGQIIARGASDDKGQMFIHIKAAESLLKGEGKLPVNIKLLVEGEEEIGSPNLGKFIKENRDRLKADVCIVSDSGMPDVDTPAITCALRGIMALDIIVTGPSRDLHSGMYGGMVHNPAQAVAEIVAKLHNPDGSVAVPGFYDDVVELTDYERQEVNQVPLTEEDVIANLGIPQVWGEPAYTLRERIGARPTLEINGIASGFYGEGSKTVLPARAIAKITCRLVLDQQPSRLLQQIRDYVAQITPPTVRSEVITHGGSSTAVCVDITRPEMQAAVTAYEKGWGKRPVFVREGGSIPVVADFQNELHLPVILMGYGLTDDGAHGPNERFVIEMFHKGIDTAIHYLNEVAK